MKTAEVREGGFYLARISGFNTVLRLDQIVKHKGTSYTTPLTVRKTRASTNFICTNLRTGRQINVRGAAKFRRAVTAEQAQALIDRKQSR